MSKVIAIITGTRAEYGLLSGISRELREQGAQVKLIVTGAHLSAAHGMTITHIEEPIAAKIDMQLEADTPLALAQATGRATSGIATALIACQPELVVILGDRYEMLAAATAAFMLHLPIAHIHGGEVTEGAMDESIRHAITKLSTWHFASAAPHAARIHQLGEDPTHIFTLGAPGLDALAQSPIPRAELERDLGIAFKNPTALFTYHPETLSPLSIDSQIATILAVLSVRSDITWLITGANADAGGRAINHALAQFAQDHGNAVFYTSLAKRYVSALRECDIVVGNSSSALIEAPALGKIAVNIGDRQKGRLRAPTVLDCPCDTAQILATLEKALDPATQKSAQPSDLFGTPGTISAAIARALLYLPIQQHRQKIFHDSKK